MNKLAFFIIGIALCATASAETATYNVYVHKSGLDPNIILQQQQAQIEQQSADNFRQLNSAIEAYAEKRRQKKLEERKAAFATDLLVATDGLKNITPDNIVALIKKYPDYTDQLLQILQAKTATK